MTVVVSTGSFSANTVTGNQVVAHGCAQTPKVILFLEGQDIAADDTGAQFNIGAATSSADRFAVGSAEANGLATTSCANTISDTSCLWRVSPSAVDVLRLDLVSIGATNFTVNVLATNGSAQDVHFIALAGSELEVDCISASITSGTGNINVSTTVTNPGAILLASTLLADDNHDMAADYKLCLGFAASATKRGAIGLFGDSVVADSNTSKWQRTNRVLAGVGPNQATESEYDFVSFSTNTVTLNRVVNTAARRVVGLVLGGAALFDVHSFNQATSTGNQSKTGVGFRPVINFFMGANTASDTSAKIDHSLTFGYGISSSDRKALSSHAEDNTPFDRGLTGYSATKCIRHISGTTAVVVDTDANFVSQDADGYTINNTTVDATSRQVLVLSIGSDERFVQSHAQSAGSFVKASTTTQALGSHAESSAIFTQDADVTKPVASYAGSAAAFLQLTTSTQTVSSYSSSSSAFSSLQGSAGDDTTVDPVVVSGDVYKTYQDTQSRHWTAAVMSKVVTLSPGNNVLLTVSDANPFPVVRRTSAGIEIVNPVSQDGAPFVEGVTPGIPLIAEEETAIPAFIGAGELGVPRMKNRAIGICLRDGSGENLGTVTNPLSVNPAGSGVQAVSDGGASLTVDTSGVPLQVAGAVTISSGTLTVNGGSGPFPVAGLIAQGVAVSGNPVLVGMEARTTDPVPVSTGQAVRQYGDSLGKPVVLLGAPHDLCGSGTVAVTTTAATVLAAPGAGQRWVVTSVLVTNAHATIASKVEIRDGGVIKILGAAGPIDGGWSQDGILFIGSVNTAIMARCQTASADVDVSISGYRISN